MKNDNSFSETQRFNHPVFVAFLVLLTIYIVSKWMNVIYGSVSGDDANSLWGSFIVLLLIDSLFLITKLQTRINEKGVCIKFFPFHFSYVFYSWEDIEKIEVREYKPLREFGGWGIRFGSRGAKAFNTRGKVGIDILLKDGRKRLIGTQKGEDALAAINANQKS